MTVDKLAALRKTDLFGSLPEPILKKIAAVAVARELTRGQLLYSEREEATGLYVVVRGELRSVRQNHDGREQVLSTERPGAILAAVPVFNGGKFFSTIIADSSAVVLRIEKQHVHDFCREHTELLWNLARVLAHKVRHYAELIEILALRNVEQRVAQHILTIARERGVAVGERCIVELTLSRAEIASRVGSVREVVSRSFADLQKRGLIEVEGRRLVTVPDMRKLAAFAGSNLDYRDAGLVADVRSDLA
jgi:CRP/FNR family transcriptional regulator